jgi:hypothetical protein
LPNFVYLRRNRVMLRDKLKYVLGPFPNSHGLDLDASLRFFGKRIEERSNGVPTLDAGDELRYVPPLIVRRPICLFREPLNCPAQQRKGARSIAI